MDIELRTILHKRLGGSRFEIQNLTGMVASEGDLRRAITQRKLEAHQDRAKCIERLLRIAGLLDELDSVQ